MTRVRIWPLVLHGTKCGGGGGGGYGAGPGTGATSEQGCAALTP